MRRLTQRLESELNSIGVRWVNLDDLDKVKVNLESIIKVKVFI